MWYQWIFFDEDSCTCEIIEGSSLYDVNTRAFEHYNDLLYDNKDDENYLKFINDWYPKQYVRRTLFEFCTDRPDFIPFDGYPGIDVHFHTINFKEEQK